MPKRKVTLREVTPENFQLCVKMVVSEDQSEFVAPNVYSLAQAFVNKRLSPFLVYDDKIRGVEPTSEDLPVGFVMYQIMDGVGFVMRLMIDPAVQGQGYGRATMEEVIRQLKMRPDIEMICTSVLKTNDVAHSLYRNLNFVDGLKLDEREYYLKLDWDPKAD